MQGGRGESSTKRATRWQWKILEKLGIQSEREDSNGRLEKDSKGRCESG